MKKITFLLIVVAAFVLLSPNVHGSDKTLIGRAEQINRSHIYNRSKGENPRFDYPSNVLSYEQMEKRVGLIRKYAEKFNHMYDAIDPKEVFMAAYAIIEHETSWVNYSYLDEGISFGYISMQFSTADNIFNEIGVEKDYWDQEKQAKLINYYIYEKLRLYDGNIKLAILAYNKGFNFDKDDYRYEEYLLDVLGRREIAYEIIRNRQEYSTRHYRN